MASSTLKLITEKSELNYYKVIENIFSKYTI